MRRAQRWMLDNAERVIGTVIEETGKTYEDAQADRPRIRGAVARVLGQARRGATWPTSASHYWGNPAVAGKKLPCCATSRCGVVGVIGPWNFPLVNGFGDCIPALMAGNSVILKPSEVTPLSSLLMAEMFAECGMPDGCLPGRDRRRRRPARR